jgi:hypothetical protein
MNNAPITYPLIDAIDLPRANIDAMTLEDLQGHATNVLDTIGALNEYINSPPRKSADEQRNAIALAGKLRSHMVRVRDLLQAHMLAAAIGGGVQASASGNQSSCVPHGGPHGL